MSEPSRTWAPGDHAYIGRRYVGGGRYAVDDDTNRPVTIIGSISGGPDYKAAFGHRQETPDPGEWDVIVHTCRLFSKPVSEYLLD